MVVTLSFLTEASISIRAISLFIDCGFVTSSTIVLIVVLTIIVIVAVVVARVLTGRPWSNLSKPKPKPDS